MAALRTPALGRHAAAPTMLIWPRWRPYVIVDSGRPDWDPDRYVRGWTGRVKRFATRADAERHAARLQRKLDTSITVV